MHLYHLKLENEPGMPLRQKRRLILQAFVNVDITRISSLYLLSPCSLHFLLCKHQPFTIRKVGIMTFRFAMHTSPSLEMMFTDSVACVEGKPTSKVQCPSSYRTRAGNEAVLRRASIMEKRIPEFHLLELVSNISGYKCKDYGARR